MLAFLAAVAALAAPAPNASLPTSPAAIADRLELAARGYEAAESPRERSLWALHGQRLYLALGLAPREVGDGVVRRLPPRMRADARDVLVARRSLVRLTPPTTLPPSAFRLGPPAPASRLLAWYREAERRFGVPWHVLASVNFVESAFGKVRSQSTAGAQGPMQFLPATWRAYGLGGDIHRPRDAILGAANYLRASGAPSNLRRALYAYNHSSLYVDAVLAYARVMERDVRAFHLFHAWQVFVRTPRGYLRLTAP